MSDTAGLLAALFAVFLIGALGGSVVTGGLWKEIGRIEVASGEYICDEMPNGEWWCRASGDQQ